MKTLITFLLLFINAIIAANAQIRTTSTYVNALGDTTITYSDGSSVKKSTNILGDKIVTFTDSDKSNTEIITNSFGNITKKTTTTDGQTTQSYSFSKQVNVLGDETVRYTDGTEVKTSKNILGDKIITVTQDGREIKTVKVSTDILGNKTKTVTKANGD